MTATFIAVDPGESTGVAVFDHGSLVFVVTDEPPFSFLENFIRYYMPRADIVAEVVPVRGHVNAAQERALGILEASERVKWVRPSEWKNTPHARLSDHDREMCSDTHQRDACGLGRFYLRRYSDGAPV